MAGREIPDEIPDSWQARARETAGHPVPDRLSEPPPPGGDRAEVESILEQVRRTVLDLGKASEPT
jgi:hypothetical protein